jgi:hypothetical protein
VLWFDPDGKEGGSVAEFRRIAILQGAPTVVAGDIVSDLF